MKKILALLLAMVLLLGILSGCGKKEENTDSKTETGKTAANQQDGKEEESGAPVEIKPENIFGVTAGTVLTAPEKVFDASALETLHIAFIRVEDGKQVTTEIAVGKSADGDELIYAVNGPGENKEAIYETREDGVYKYIKGSGKNPYKHDEKTAEDAVMVEKETLKSYVRIFTQYLGTFTNISYRKAIDLSVNCPTGDVYVYDVLSNDKIVGQVCIDRETGMLVKVKDLSDRKAGEQFVIDSETGLLKKEDKDTLTGTVLTMTSFKTADVQIPAYDKFSLEPKVGDIIR